MQFDVFPNPDPDSRAAYPYVVDVQADVLAALATRVIVPLGKPGIVPPKAIARLVPAVVVRGQRLHFCPADIAAIEQRELGRAVANLGQQRSELLAALDLLLTGV